MENRIQPARHSKFMKQTLSLLILPAVVLVLVFGSGSSVFAQTTTWTGAGSDWSTPTNWNNGVPTSTGTAYFDITGTGNLIVTLSSPVTVENIQFDGNNGGGTVGNYIIGSTTGNVMTLTSGGNLGYEDYSLNPNTVTINAPLIIAGTSGSSYSFEHQGSWNANSSIMIFNGTVNGAASASNTTTLNLGNENNTINGVIGDGSGGGQLAVFVNGGGTQTLAAANTYTGSTTLNYNSNATVDVTGSLGNTAISVDGGPSIYYGPGSTLNLMAAGAVSQNVITLNQGTLNESVDGAISGTASLTINGGLANLTNANSYTGPTNISGDYNNDPSLILTGTLGNTAVTVGTNPSAFPGYLELNGAGGISQNVLTIVTGNVTQGVAGAITGTASVYINESGSGAYGHTGEAFFGNGNTYTGTTTLDGNNSNITLNVTSLANGGSASSIGASSNAASNLIFGGGILQATTLTSAQSTDHLFTIGDANGGNDSATIDSSSPGANTISFTNTGAIASGNDVNQGYPIANLTLTGSNTGANTFAPLLSNLANSPTQNNAQGTTLTKSGTGNWILTNANTFTGNTYINNGTLQLGNFNALQFSNSVVLNSTNGLTFGSPGTYDIRSLTGSSNEALASGVTLQVASPIFSQYTYGNSNTYGEVLSGGGGVQMAGYANSNTQVFSTDQAYTGGTTVIGGTLETTDSSTSGTPFGTGSVSPNGGTLSFVPSGSSSTIVDNIGSVAYAGGGTISLNKGSNTSLTVNAASPGFVRSGTGTLILETNSADLGTGENVTAGAAPAMNNGIVSSPVVGLTNGGNLDFLTYGGSGFTDATAAYTNLSAPSGPSTVFTTTSNEIVNVTQGNPYSYENGQAILKGSAYAIRTVAGASAALQDGLVYTVGDGTDPAMLILNSNGFYGSNGNGIVGVNNPNSATLNFGGSQGDVFVNNWNEIDPVVAGTNGLVISGSGGSQAAPNGVGGTLTLTNLNNTFSGGITINAGATLAYTARSNYYYSGEKFTNGELGDPNNAITLNGGAINANDSYFGVGRTINLASGGGYLTGEANIVSNITGSGGLTVGNFQQYGNSPFSNYPNNNFVVLSGDNSFTGGLTLYSNYTTVSSNANLGAATSAVNFDGGFISIMGDTMQNFGSHVINFTPLTTVAIDIQNANNTFTLNQAVNTAFSSGSGGNFYKMGAGTLVLTNGGNFTGATGLGGGTLELNESNGSSIGSTALIFAGGTLDVLGAASGSTVQNFTGFVDPYGGDNVTLGNSGSGPNIGGGTLIVDSNTGDGTQSTTVNLGTFSQGIGAHSGTSNAGSTLDLAIAGNGTSTVTTTTAADSTGGGGAGTGIYGGRVVYTAGGTTNWATSTLNGAGSYTISAYNGYENFTSFVPGATIAQAATANLQLTGTDSTSLTLFWYNQYNNSNTTLTFNSLAIAPSGSGQYLDIQGFDVVLNSGGLLFTGSNDYTIQDSYGGGALKSGLKSNGGGGGDDLIIQDYATGNLTISAAIGDGADGASSLTKAGSGTLTLTGANTYTGQTFINGGTLSIGADNLISSANLNINGGALEATGSFTLSQRLYVGSAGATLNATGSNVLTINQDIWSANNYTNAYPASLTINGDGSTGTVFLNSDTNGNAFYGGVTIGGGTLKLGGQYPDQDGSGSSGDSAVLGTTPANYISWSANSSGVLELNGQPALVAGLESLSTSAVVEDGATGNYPGYVLGGKNYNSLLAVSNGDDETFAGTLVDNINPTLNGQLSFLKLGGGTMSFTNTGSSYTGRTEIDGGILNIASVANGGSDSSIGASTNAASNLIFGGGTLQYTGSTAQTTDRLFTLGDSGVGGNNGTIDASGTGAGTVTFTNTGSVAYGNTGVHNLTLTGTNTGANTLNPVIGDSTYNSTVFPTSVSKTGTGSWALAGNNTYSGGTTVFGGTLYANDTTSSTGTGSVTVNSGATLSGTGTIAPTGSNGVSIAGGGTIAPGGVQSGSTANGNLTLNVAGITPGSTILSLNGSSSIPANNAGLTFALGAGVTANGNGEILTGSKIIVGDGGVPVANTIAFDVGGGSSNVVTIDDLTHGSLLSGRDYVLIEGDPTTYTGLTLAASDTIFNGYNLGQEITGGLSVVSPYGSGGELYQNGDNIDFAITPEPSTWALMFGALALLACYRRRQCRQS